MVGDEQLVRVIVNYLFAVISSVHGIVVCLPQSEAILSAWCLTMFQGNLLLSS